MNNFFSVSDGGRRGRGARRPKQILLICALCVLRIFNAKTGFKCGKCTMEPPTQLVAQTWETNACPTHAFDLPQKMQRKQKQKLIAMRLCLPHRLHHRHHRLWRHLVATPRLTSRGRGSWGSAGRLTQLHMQHFAAATNCNLDCAGMQHVDVICKLYAVAIVSADFLRNISPPAALLSSRKMRKLGKKRDLRSFRPWK